MVRVTETGWWAQDLTDIGFQASLQLDPSLIEAIKLDGSCHPAPTNEVEEVGDQDAFFALEMHSTTGGIMNQVRANAVVVVVMCAPLDVVLLISFPNVASARVPTDAVSA